MCNDQFNLILFKLFENYLFSAMMAHRGHLCLQRPGDRQKRSGEVPDDPVGWRPVPQALSCNVISFEPRTRRWLAEAITGLLGQEALEDKGDYRKGSGEVPRRPCGAQARPPGPVSPRYLS